MDPLDALRSGQFAGHKRLNLSCDLTEFPLEVLDLSDSLEILDLSNNHLSSLPKEFEQLQKLKAVFFINNVFDEFPAILSACPNLSMIGFKGNQLRKIGEGVLAPTIRWLILTNNQLETLPTDIGNLSKLQKCMLAGNRLQSIPNELANCRNLELIRLSANQLPQLPESLLTLPRLSWLAYAGNPFCESKKATAELSETRSLLAIDEDELQLGEVLGQGASGVIYKALWTPKSPDSHAAVSNQPQTVAVKLFKGSITSDGLPLDEMQACIAAGAHPNLVSVLGKLSRPLEGKAGLIFSFIPADYEILGNPPSLETCSRDTYREDTSFTLPVIVNIARSIASAASHLHANGIMHGDLYAHNTLVNSSGEAILSDFGAASFYHPTDADAAIGQALERIEVRAFGCLLEDLLDRHTPDEENDPMKEEGGLALLRNLQQDCMHPVPNTRPLFPKILETLVNL